MNEQETTYRVRVEEHRREELAGVGGAHYLSPPQSAAAAAGLLRLVLGHEAGAGERSWRMPVAGGIRRVELLEVGDEPAR